MLKKLTAAGIVAAAASGALLMAAPANAGIDTSGDGGILSGNQIIAPVSIPVNVCGNSVAVLGISGAGCRGGASVGAPLHHHGYHHPWDS
ncbi:chaplin [Actinomadura sp. DC4]|uniref:chaplin n=1 Tax=Actinomadura sp. DC4 TaxID=3055069 RepID=UPI0025B06EA4|nr:chaplin [Actinomadura sp. DC4]MDN3353912.1 chaplin [Actinomadura sp. DC4]